jgi:ubiquitin carboxyl-terminal hydrolase L3
MAAAAPASPRENDFWVPLESNPAVLSRFAASLGLPEKWGFSDCFGLDPELLAMLPQPCLALIFLFPYTKMAAYKAEQHDRLVASGQHISPQVYFMKQLVGNACGTVAVVHCLANNAQALGIKEGFFTQLLERTRNLSPEQKGRSFGKEEGLAAAAHAAATDSSAQTEAPEADADVDSHFVCFTVVDGHLYELDGAKAFPVNHGPSNAGSFLQDAARVLQTEYIQRLQDDIRFSVIAFGAKPSEEFD